MAEQTIHDLLSVDVDSEETKTLNSTAVISLKSVGPNGEIIFDSTQQTLPGFIADTASLALTASTAPLYLLLAGGTITGNLTVTGTTTLNRVISVTSSYSSGSTIFGDALSDTHQFTGSVFITGSSFNWNNSRVITSNITSSMSVASASYASQAENSSTIDINVFGIPVESYLLMSNVAGTTGVAIGGDTELRYNSSTNILSVPNISATSLTGSLLGTASNAISALTASFYGGSVTSASNASTASLALRISASSINSNNSKLYGSSNVESIDWSARTTFDASNIKSINWGDRALFDSSGTSIVTWVSGSLVGTGSLQGTSSWATNAVTASRVPSYETAWTSYTPAWTTDGIQPTLGDGSITGAYKLIGKTCFVRVRLYWGTTTNSGTGVFYFSLPVSASSTWGIQMPASMLDNGNAWYQATVNGEYGGFTNRTALIGQSAGGANSSQGITGTFPFTFGNLDSIQFNGSYETV